MSVRANGGVIGPDRSATAAAASGVWRLKTQEDARLRNSWPLLDTYFGNVSLLLTGETDADTSLNGFAITKNGNAATSTAQVKYGTRSWLFDGTGDFLSLSGNAAFNFGTDSFTIEAWVYIAGNSTGDALNNRNAAIFTVGLPLVFGIGGNSTTTGTSLYLYKNSGGEASITGAASVTQSTWHHCAVSKSGSSVRLFLNGSQVGTTATNTASWGSSTSAPRVASWDQSSFLGQLNGYIDELRVTKGVARYTADFTPPASIA